MKGIKKIYFFICLMLAMQVAYPQGLNVDSMLQKIALEKDDNQRIDLIYSIYSATSETDPQISIANAQKVLEQSQKNNDKIGEAMALATTGASYRLMGNTTKGLEYHLKAMTIAEQTTSLKLIAYIKVNMGNIYRDRGDYNEAIKLYLSSQQDAVASGSYKYESWNFGNLGIIYLSLNKSDSALMYSQRAYEICLQHNYTQFMSDILSQLGGIQGKMGNSSLAVSYYSMAID